MRYNFEMIFKEKSNDKSNLDNSKSLVNLTFRIHSNFSSNNFQFSSSSQNFN